MSETEKKPRTKAVGLDRVVASFKKVEDAALNAARLVGHCIKLTLDTDALESLNEILSASTDAKGCADDVYKEVAKLKNASYKIPGSLPRKPRVKKVTVKTENLSFYEGMLAGEELVIVPGAPRAMVFLQNQDGKKYLVAKAHVVSNRKPRGPRKVKAPAAEAPAADAVAA